MQPLLRRYESLLKQGSKRTAVLITGNPKFIDNNPDAHSFYDSLEHFMVGKGYSVVRDAGEPHTRPPKADVWVGHSRGVDRFPYAPEGTLTIRVGAPGGINHPEDKAMEPGQVPNKSHFLLTEAMKKSISNELEQFKKASEEKEAIDLEGAQQLLRSAKANSVKVKQLPVGPAYHSTDDQIKNIFVKGTLPKVEKVMGEVGVPPEQIAGYRKSLTEVVLPHQLDASKAMPTVPGYINLPKKGDPAAAIRKAYPARGEPMTREEHIFNNAMAVGHEKSERNVVRNGEYNMATSGMGHFSPKVLLREHNMNVTLPAEAGRVGQMYREMRDASGDAGMLSSLGVNYGVSPRLSRHAIKRLSEAAEAKTLGHMKEQVGEAVERGEKLAGDTKKKIEFQGIEVNIDRPKGFVQKFKNGSTRTYKTDYGFFPGTKSRDGEDLDTYIGPDKKAKNAYIISQKINGKIDEKKVMLGFGTEDSAKDMFLSHYSPEMKSSVIGKIETVPMEEFKVNLGTAKYASEKLRSFFDELVKLGEVTEEEAAHALDRYEKVNQMKMDAEQLKNNMLIGAASKPTMRLVSNAIMGAPLIKGAPGARLGKTRGVLADMLMGSVGAAGLTMLKQHADEQAYKNKVEQFLKERTQKEKATQIVEHPFEPPNYPPDVMHKLEEPVGIKAAGVAINPGGLAYKAKAAGRTPGFAGKGSGIAHTMGINPNTNLNKAVPANTNTSVPKV